RPMHEHTNTTPLTIVSPVAEYQDVAKEVSRHARRRGVSGKRALLLPAEKSSSPPFMHALVARMTAETDAQRVFTSNPDWPFFHPQRAVAIAPAIDALARECDVMLSGIAY